LDAEASIAGLRHFDYYKLVAETST